VTLSQEDLFKLALNLQDPWYIKSIEFSNAKKQIDIHINFIPGSRFKCSNCKSPNNCIHDTKERVWRHLNFFQFKAYLRLGKLQFNLPTWFSEEPAKMIIKSKKKGN